jgi:hypothetical protein
MIEPDDPLARPSASERLLADLTIQIAQRLQAGEAVVT